MQVDGDAELCALLTVAQSITPVLCRVQAYEAVFTTDNTGKADLQDLQETSIQVYGTCFRLIAHTSQELESKMRRFRHAILEPGQGSAMIEELGKLETLHDKAVQRCNITLSTESTRKVAAALDELKTTIEEIKGQLGRIETGVYFLVAKVKENELDEISKVKYTDDHKAVKALRAENTCKWLVASQKFDQWLELERSSIFWLRGDGRNALPDHFPHHH